MRTDKMGNPNNRPPGTKPPLLMEGTSKEAPSWAEYYAVPGKGLVKRFPMRRAQGREGEGKDDGKGKGKGKEEDRKGEGKGR